MGKKGVKRGKIHVTRLQTEKCCPDDTPVVLGVDPGIQGHFVIFNGKGFESFKMPIRKIGKTNEIIFGDVHKLLFALKEKFEGLHVYLERAVSFGMGSTGAFNYGRGFAALEIAIELIGMPVTYVEPGKWTKEMHQGIASDLKPKAKSLVAVRRLYPKLVQSIPTNKNGKMDEGCVDALLIAGYGLKNQTTVKQVDSRDFY